MRAKSYLEWAVCIAGGSYILLFLGLTVLRLIYPYEIEWLEGAILDHAIRVLDGKPLYTAPSLEFSAFIYTPIYYYVVALVMQVTGIAMVAGRLVSLLSTLATAVLISHITQRETESKLLTFSSAALYIAFFHETGYFYDIVRMDALALLLAVAAIYVALYAKRGPIIAAILITLAYFTKQQMICFWPAFTFWFLIRGGVPFKERRKQAFVFTGVSLGLILITSLALNAASHGWFAFYTLRLPSAKTHLFFSTQRAIAFFHIKMLGTFALTTIVIAFACIVGLYRSLKEGSRYFLLLLCYFASILAASLSMGNAGGYKNVLMPLAATIAILFPICLQRIVLNLKLQENLVQWILLFEFFALAFNPLGEKMLLASSRQQKAGDEFMAKLKTIPGDVWIPMHGYLNRLAGKPMHPHFMAMNDALSIQDTTSTRLQREIDSAYSTHHFAAIILDEDHSFPPDSIPYYSLRGKIFQTPNVFISRLADEATRPQYIYLPAP